MPKTSSVSLFASATRNPPATVLTVAAESVPKPVMRLSVPTLNAVDVKNVAIKYLPAR